MIEIEEARKRIKSAVYPLNSELCKIEHANSLMLAEDIISPVDLPGFRHSAMDGYAMQRRDLGSGIRKFRIQQEVQAGHTNPMTVESGHAVRIFTGAVVPDNADIVIIQEKTELQKDVVLVTEYSGNEKSNIREKGEQIKKGEIALKSGHQINPATVGFLSSMGITDVRVYRRPRISVLITGNELRIPGEPLELGEIYESNSNMLQAALGDNQFQLLELARVKDTEEATVEQIGELLRSSDVLIISGGISVGKYDFVKRALELNGVTEVFYKINQKPGKPMYFGEKSGKLIFALPGNPASLLVCFYVYVLDALKLLAGRTEIFEFSMFTLSHDHHKKGERPEFARAIYKDARVSILSGQGSNILKSFAEANSLVYLHPGNQTLSKGDMVKVLPIFTI